MLTKVLAVLTAGLLAASLAAATASAAPPERLELPADVVAAMEAAQPGDQIAVVVTFAARPDLAGPGGERRAERRQRVIERLQDHATDSQAAAMAQLRPDQEQGRVGRADRLWVANALALSAEPDVIDRLARRPDIASIVLDEVELVETYATPEPGVAAVGAPTLWDAGHTGHDATGQGVVVAVLDSGAYASHADLASSYRGGTNSWFDPYGQNATPADNTGHGTGVLGVIVGGEAGGTSIGVAPDAEWIAAKIYDNSGNATISAIHSAFQWVLDPDGNPATDDGADVVNNSWAIGGAGCSLTFQADLQALRAAGVVPVFAAGNYGPGAGSSPSPANNPEALAVGAIDAATNAIYGSSSRGPSACGEGSTVFPEVVAPGVGVRTTERWGLYTNSTGTSIAAPHVTGALALLLGAHPNLTDVEQIDALTATAVDLGATGADDTFGHGLIDVAAALNLIENPPGPNLFADGFESGDTSAWPTTVNFKNRLSVTSAAALDGSFGMQIEILNGRDLYVSDTSPDGAVAYTAQFRFDPNSVSMPNNKVQDLLLALDDGGSRVIRVQFRSSSGQYQLRARAFDDQGKGKSSSWAPITDDSHLIEVDWLAADNPAGNNGRVAISVDGVALTSKSGLKNGSTSLDEIRLGAPLALHKNTRGTEFFDDYVIVAMSPS